jgi:hypothetical protein
MDRENETPNGGQTVVFTSDNVPHWFPSPARPDITQSDVHRMQWELNAALYDLGKSCINDPDDCQAAVLATTARFDPITRYDLICRVMNAAFRYELLHVLYGMEPSTPILNVSVWGMIRSVVQHGSRHMFTVFERVVHGCPPIYPRQIPPRFSV